MVKQNMNTNQTEKIIELVKNALNLNPNNENVKDVIVEEKGGLIRILIWARVFGLYEWEILKQELSKLDLAPTSFEICASEEGLIHIVIYVR
jgi:hypothetical protein